MNKIFTQLTYESIPVRCNLALTTTLFFLMLLLQVNTVWAQTTPTTTIPPSTTPTSNPSICVGSSVTFTSSYNNSGNNNFAPKSLVWQYSSNNGTSWSTINATNAPVSGTIVNNPADFSSNTVTTTLTLTGIPTSYSGQYRVVYTTTNNSTRITPSPATLTVNALPKATITTTTPLTFCSEGSVVLSANTGTGFTYQWRKDNNPAPGANTGATYSAIESGSYQVIVTSNGCSTTSTAIVVNELQTPTATIAPPTTPTTFCEGGAIQLSAIASPATAPAPGSYSYTWYKGATAIPGATDATYSAFETGSYSVVITNRVIINNTTFACSSPASSPVAVTVNPNPKASISYNTPLTFCSEGSVLLSANTGTGFTYEWRKDNNPAPGANSGDTYSATESGSYQVIVTSNTCSITSAAVVVNEIKTPAASITTTTPTSFCTGGSVLLSATADPATAPASGVYSYTWYNGTSIISDATGATFLAEKSGNYSVVITNTTGAVACPSPASEPVAVTVNPFPTATITAPNGTSSCPGTSVLLRVEPVEGATYAWLLNNDPIANANGTEYSASSTGNYSVQVTTNGCTKTSADAIAVTILSPATVIAEGPTASFCAGNPITLHAVTGIGYTYQWIKNGIPVLVTDGGNSANLTVNEVGDYQVTVTIIGANNCITVSDITRVTQTPAIVNNTITAPATTTICANTSPGIIAGGIPGPSGGNGTTYAYQWERSEDDGATFNIINLATDPSYTPGELTTTTIFRRVVTSECSSISNTVTIIVNPVIVGNTITAPQITTICAGTAPATITGVEPTGGNGTSYTYQWESRIEGELFTALTGATNPDYSPGNLTETTWFRRVTSSGACTNDVSNEVQIIVNPLPTASAGPAQVLCSAASGTTFFTLGGTGANATYQWAQVGQSGTASATILNSNLLNSGVNVTGTGSVTLQLTATSNTTPACGDPIISTVVLTVNPSPIANAGADQAACFTTNGTAFTLAGQGSNGTFLWTQVSQTGTATATFADATSLTSGVSVTGTGTVTLRLTTSSNTNPLCGTATDDVILTVNPLPTASAGPAQVLCSAVNGPTFFTLAGTGANATYQWTQAGQSGTASATILNPTLLNSGVNVTGTGSVTLQLTATSNTTPACGDPIISTVVLTVNPSPIANAGADQAACFTTNGTAFTLAGQGSNGTFLWEQISTTGTATATFADATSLTSGVSITGTGTVTLRLTTSSNTNPTCNTAAAEVTLTVNPTPIAIAGPAQTLCATPNGTVFTLAGVAENGTSAWLQTNRTGTATATFADPNSPTSAVTVTGTGTVTLQLTTTSNASPACTPAATDIVVLTVNPTPIANAGLDQTLCATPNGTAFTLAGVAENGTSAWLQTNSTGTATATFADPNSPTSAVTVTGTGTVTLQLTTTSNASPVCKPAATDIVVLTVNSTPVASFTGLTNGQIVYTGGGNITLNSSPAGGFFTINGVQTTSTTFNPCTRGPGNYTITYTATIGTCSNSTTPITVTVRESTYSIIVISNPKPFCRGVNVGHTAYVYRDAVIEYPYLVNAQGQPVRVDGVTLVGPNELPVANQNFSKTQGATQAVKDNAFRFFDPIVISGTLVTSGITYQWTKNQANEIGSDGQVFGNAGLSSLEYYAAYVSVSSSNACGPNITNRLSTRAYTGALPDYEIVLSIAPNPICPGASVTLTATLDPQFQYWANSNLRVNWVVTRNGTATTFATSGYTGTNNLIQLTTTGPGGALGNFQNGDQISIVYSSDIDQFYGASKCGGDIVTNTIAMKVALPQVITGGAYCIGSNGFAIRMNSSQTDIIYELVNAVEKVVDSRQGTGSTITFNNQLAGNYSVRPVTASGTCESFGSVTITETPLPQAFDVSGGGAYCSGANPTGVAVILSNSQAGVSYQLQRNGTNVGSPVTGTGNLITFNNQTAGTYTIVATTIANQPARAGGCPRTMNGNALITTTPLPTAYDVTGAGYYCFGGEGLPVGLSNSQTGVNYQLVRNGVNVPDAVIEGTGDAISFGIQTTGTYTIVATTIANQPATAGNCPRLMNGNATLLITPLPNVYKVTGGGNYCFGGEGLPVGLSNSQVGVGYQLLRNGTELISYSREGTGGPITFGNQTAAGTYTIVASTPLTSISTACPQNMEGSVTIDIIPLPTFITTLPASTTLCRGDNPTFSVQATGANIVLNWYKGTSTTPITQGVTTSTDNGTTTSTLQLLNVQVADAGDYFVRVSSSSCNPPQTSATRVVVNTPIELAAIQPATLCEGSSTSLVAVVTGSGNLTYQWFRKLSDGSSQKLDNATSSTLNLNSVTLDQDGTYYLMVSGGNCGDASRTSNDVTLKVNPTIANSISRLTIEEPNELKVGEPAVYKVKPNGGITTWTYEWIIYYSNGGDEKSSETSNTLTIPSARKDMIGISVTQIAPANLCASKSSSVIVQDLNVLPVELIYLKADKHDKNVVKVEWATAMEKDNKGFEVQVSQDAKNYRTLSFVPTQNGNTLLRQVYTFYDKESGKKDTRYYRLKQMDMNGDTKYFGPKAVKMDQIEEPTLAAYPNPFTSEVNLEFTAEESGTMLVEVTSALGAKVYEKTLKVEKGFRKETIQLSSNLANGVYIITTRMGDKTNHIRLMKQL